MRRILILTACLLASSAALAADDADFPQGGPNYQQPQFDKPDIQRALPLNARRWNPSITTRKYPGVIYPAGPDMLNPSEAAQQCARKAGTRSYTLKVVQDDKSFSTSCTILD